MQGVSYFRVAETGHGAEAFDSILIMEPGVSYKMIKDEEPFAHSIRVQVCMNVVLESRNNWTEVQYHKAAGHLP